MVNAYIRAGSPADLGALAEIDRLCFEAEIVFGREELHAYLSDADTLTWVAETSATPVGFAIAELDNKTLSAHLVTLDVLPHHRRSGLGSLLLRSVETELASRGARTHTLEVDTSNQPALAFYRRHLFRTIRTLRAYYPNGRDAFLMRKPL
jgi:ribosomal-protein-alanine N-acetyltransferase